MHIIPVIDLKAGHVVHAIAGNRKHYQPIDSPLCPSSNVFDVIDAFMSVYPFSRCYIADLDAINQSGHHQMVIAELLNRYREVEFIVDAGFDADFFTRHYPDNYLPILGSESLTHEYLKILAENSNFHYILSLDYLMEKQLGPELLFADSRFWPKDIIIMPLNNVGGVNGPDFVRLKAYLAHKRNHNVIAAGGVRNTDDLNRLKNAGIHAVLLASALHSNAIGKTDLLCFSQVTLPSF